MPCDSSICVIARISRRSLGVGKCIQKGRGPDTLLATLGAERQMRLLRLAGAAGYAGFTPVGAGRGCTSWVKKFCADTLSCGGFLFCRDLTLPRA